MKPIGKLINTQHASKTCLSKGTGSAFQECSFEIQVATRFKRVHLKYKWPHVGTHRERPAKKDETRTTLQHMPNSHDHGDEHDLTKCRTPTATVMNMISPCDVVFGRAARGLHHAHHVFLCFVCLCFSLCFLCVYPLIFLLFRHPEMLLKSTSKRYQHVSKNHRKSIPKRPQNPSQNPFKTPSRWS